jgi:cytochrome c55X
LSNRSILLLLAVFFLPNSAAWAQETQPPPEPAAAGTAAAPVNADLIERGKQLYAHDCSHCHGFNMVNPGTISYDLRQFPHNDKGRFLNSVTNGKNGRMPPWAGSLSPEEIEQIWAYVLTGGKS